VGGQGDSGVSTRLFGTVLTWLADHESDVFFIATANDISKLPPEFTRAERLDALFFLDLPSAAEKAVIWRMYRRQFGLAEGLKQPADGDWTGAEIRACCRLATLLGVSLEQAAAHVVPVAVTAAESMERLRTWASGRCLAASSPGIYQRRGESSTRPGRRIHRGPSPN
jgi:SpoVK/Ycf46/Vps4 family AAA+-type ATPase